MDTAGNQLIRLSDERRLGVAGYGDPQGTPVVYFHGFPASRLEAALIDAAACRLGLRIIAPDRPGIGLSDFRPERTIGDWPRDMTELADLMELERFAVLGVSGGAPYALACAVEMPARISAVAIVGGLGPLDRPGATAGMSLLNRFFLRLFRLSPGAGGILFASLALLARHHPERLFALFTANVPAADRAVLTPPATRLAFLASIREAVRSGWRGGARELYLYSRPWGFDLARIGVRVDLWHGRLDATVPVVMGEVLARAIPDCRSRFLPDDGHFSLPLNHTEEILRTLVGR